MSVRARGIDISYAQATTPSFTGLDFVVCRATYRDHEDRRWSQHSAAARAAGLILGAYHFGTDVAGVTADGVAWSSPIAVQVAAFLSVAAGADILFLDLESEGADTMSSAQAAAFIAGVHKAGRKIGLYHSLAGFPSIGQDFDWVAYWSSTEPPRRWTFWQYRGDPLDLDLFNSDVTELRAFVGSTAGGTIQEDSMLGPIDTHEAKLIDLPAGESQFLEDGKTADTVKTAGGKAIVSPFGYKNLRAFYVSVTLGVFGIRWAAPAAIYALPAPSPIDATAAELRSSFNAGVVAAAQAAATAAEP